MIWSLICLMIFVIGMKYLISLRKEIVKLKQDKRKLELEAQYLKATIEENKLCAGRMAGMSCPEYYLDMSRKIYELRERLQAITNRYTSF